MNRLIVATGPWQIILAASALRQETIELDTISMDYLILCGHNLSNEFKQTMMSIAISVWNWQGIIWTEDLLYSNLPILNSDNFLKISQTLKKRIPAINYDEIWLCHLAQNTAKFILETYQKAAIILYEDGLHSYVSYEHIDLLDTHNLITKKELKLLLKRFILRQAKPYDIINKRGLCQRHLNRLKRVHLSLLNYLPVPEYMNQAVIKKIQAESLITSVKAIQRNIKLNNILNSRKSLDNNVLVLGQCFSKWEIISWQEEFKLYKNICSTLIHNNLVPLWKEHPRVNKPFYDSLVNELPSVKKIDLNFHYSWPIEIFLDQLDIKACVAATSTSLFYLKEIFEIPTYTFAHELPNLSNQEFSSMADIVINKIPKLNLLKSDKNKKLYC